MIKPTKMQQEVIDTNNEVVIVATGRGSGRTTALTLKALSPEYDNKSITFIYKTQREAVDNIYKMFEIASSYDIDCHVSKCDMCIQFEGDKVITFICVYDYLSRDYVYNPILFVEDIHLINIDPDYYSELVCTTTPWHCGWRNPKYENGIQIIEEWGEYVYDEYSWDRYLIEWDKVGNGTFKCQPWDYKRNVSVITDYGVEDNPVMHESYIAVLNDLPQTDKVRMQGYWG